MRQFIDTNKTIINKNWLIISMPEFIPSKAAGYKFTYRLLLLTLGCLSLVLGLFYYLSIRGAPPAILLQLPYFGDFSISTLLNVFDRSALIYPEWVYALPSFIHVVAFSLLTLSVLPLSRPFIIAVPIVWLIINIGFEAGQGLAAFVDPVLSDSSWSIIQLIHHYLISGTFAMSDIVAAILGALFGYYMLDQITIRFQGIHNVSAPRVVHGAQLTLVTGILLGGVLSLAGSDTCNDSSDSDCRFQYNAEPIYMSYDELRTTAIVTKQDQPLTKTGKIYLYQNYLLINSPNQGIHIFDNIDPANPTKLTFINIPGNVDIAIKQDYLYVDSYIDLVTIDISDMNAIKEVHRVNDMFAYNPYQNIPKGIYFRSIDKTKGVIIGYTRKN